MLRSVLLRCGIAIPTAIGVLFIAFIVEHLIPGDPTRAILGISATPQQIAALRHSLGLDRSLLAQFGTFASHYAHGDLGVSLTSRQPVSTEIGSRIGYTMSLAVAGTLFAVVVGIPLGVLGAIHKGRLGDYVTQAIGTIGVAVPEFWLALVLVRIFAIGLGWFPATGAGNFSSPGSVLHGLVLPAVAVALPAMALVSRMTRSTTLDVIVEDFIRTARAKGLRERSVLFRHVLPNAALPVLTVTGLAFGSLLGGTIAVEVVFARPGLGSLLFDGILSRDYPLIQGVTAVIAVIFVAVNLLTDLCYLILDPRIRHE